MSILCAWCGFWIRKELPTGLVSHGICRTCADRMYQQLEASEDGRPEKPPCPQH